MRRYPGDGAFALFFHPNPREFATQNKSKGPVSQLMDDLDLINRVEQVEAMVNSIQKRVENVLRK